MTDMQEIECMECGKKFERDMDNPRVRKAVQSMGVVADQCPDCLRKWLEREKRESEEEL